MGATSRWNWPSSMDAVLAAPGSHRVLFENDDVRVLEVTIATGDREPEHTHRDPSVMVVDGPARIRYWHVLADPEGNDFCLLKARLNPL